MRYARDHNLARLVLGRREGGLLAARWRRSLADAVAALADDIDVLQVALPAQARSAEPPEPQHDWPWRGYVAATAACVLTALLATPLLGRLELTNIVMLFLLTVIGVALAFGRGPAVLAAFLGVGLFDFFFVPPRFSFAVSDVQYLVTFGVMLLVALLIGQLTAGLKAQAGAATERERRMRGLYEMSRDLGAALLPEQVADIGARFLSAEFGAQSALFTLDAQDRLQLLPGSASQADAGVAQWAFDHGLPAGRGTDTLPATACLMLPLKAPMRLRGVLAVQSNEVDSWSPEQRQLLDTCAALIAISLERIHYIEVAQASTLQMEGERLRNSLLAAISHDLRTPLASLVGLADTLERQQPRADQAELLQAMRASALRMNALVNNVLDMARLEAGAVELNKQWQPLEEVVGSALEACAQPLADHPLQVVLAADLPLLQIDAVLMERVLVNLLENAAKYTPPGTALTLRAAPRGDQIELVLEDEGPGLPRGREDQLFQKFERGRKESALPGVGLGLAICRAIVEAHGGRIRAEAREPRGARFVIALPRGNPPTDLGTEE